MVGVTGSIPVAPTTRSGQKILMKYAYERCVLPISIGQNNASPKKSVQKLATSRMDFFDYTVFEAYSRILTLWRYGQTYLQDRGGYSFDLSA